MSRLLTLMGARAFSPLSLSPALWLDASDLSTLYTDSTFNTPVASDGDPVGGWRDKSGNGRHATQATSAKRPLYKVAQQNGRSVLLLDGVDDTLSIPSDATLSQTALTLCFVYKKVATLLGSLIANTAGGSYFRFGAATQILYYTNDGATNDLATASGIVDDGNYHVMIGTHNATKKMVYQDSTQKLNLTTTIGALASPYSGLGQYAGGSFLSGNLAEVIILQRMISTPELTQLQAYLKVRWGTP